MEYNFIRVLRTICLILSLSFTFYILTYDFKVKEENKILQEKIQYYEKIVQDFEADELITHPELYSEGYVEQIKVHSCMWAFEVQVCE